MPLQENGSKDYDKSEKEDNNLFESGSKMKNVSGEANKIENQNQVR